MIMNDINETMSGIDTIFGIRTLKSIFLKTKIF